MGFMKTEQERIKAMAEDIKKALELCTKDEDCEKCPYAKYGCTRLLRKDSFALITEQEKEIERLRTTLGQCNTELNSALESLKSQCREIGALKAVTKQAKIDVLNKVKERAVGLATIETYHICNLIDELINEVKNEQKD